MNTRKLGLNANSIETFLEVAARLKANGELDECAAALWNVALTPMPNASMKEKKLPTKSKKR